MRRGIRAAVLVLATGAVLVGGYALAAEIAVTMTPSGPQPSTLTVNLGDTVKWTNGGSVNYGIASGRLGITSPAVTPGATFSYVVTRSGSFAYQQQGADKSRFDGAIVVQRTGSVTLGASRAAVPFGTQIALRGTTTLPGFPVTVEQKESGQRAWTTVATLAPESDGSFAVGVTPKIGVTYRARALLNELVSDSVVVAVKPRVTIRSVPKQAATGKIATVTVRVVPASAARSVDIVRYDRKRLVWKRLSTRPVTTAGVATYRWKIEYGRTLLRGWLKKSNLRPGFGESSSIQILVKGIGKPPEPERKKRERVKKKREPRRERRST